MIPDFDKKFIKIIKNIKSQQNKFVFGLSGGIDSMCLLHLLKKFIDNNKNLQIELTPIIVDHNLRENSKNEAKEVLKISQSLGFNTHVNKILETKPDGNIQNWARKRRRDILFQKCLELSANLILAHHIDDQAETLFMRLIRESSLDGLSGMRKISRWNGIFILRPLLSYNKKQISNHVIKKKIVYFEDSSNINLKYERVKTRFLIESIKRNTWPSISCDLNFFSNLNANLLTKINLIFKTWAKENILIDNSGAVRVNYNSLKTIFKKSQLFSIRIVGKIIQTVGGNEYVPKRKKTFELISSFVASKFNKRSLGNVNIFLSRGYLFFIRENRNLNFEISVVKNKIYIFDGRFLLKSPLPGKLIKCFESNIVSTNKNNPFYEHSFLINNTIPYLRTLEGKTIKPHIYNINNNSTQNHFNNDCFSLHFINKILI